MGISNPNTDVLASDGNQNIKKMLIMKADKVDIEKIYEVIIKYKINESNI